MKTKNNNSIVFKTKILEDDSDFNIEAVATTFENKDKVGDIIKTGALDEYISDFKAGKTEPLRMLLMHNRSIIIGEWGDIEIKGDEVIIKGNMLIDTQAGKDTMLLIKKRLLSSVSIGFNSSEYTFNDADYTITFQKITLVETSIVDNPGNENAIVLDTKNYKGEFDLKIIERALRNVGLSNKQAKAFISKGKGGLLGQREVDETENALELLKDFEAKI